MKPTPQLLNEIEATKREQAEQMDDISRALAGARLFDELRNRLSWGVLVDLPEATESEVEREVRSRLKVLRQDELNHG